MIEIQDAQKILSYLNYVDLFAGIGGFRLALDSFDANCIFSSEWDGHAQDVYFDNFGDFYFTLLFFFLGKQSS